MSNATLPAYRSPVQNNLTTAGIAAHVQHLREKAHEALCWHYMHGTLPLPKALADLRDALQPMYSCVMQLERDAAEQADREDAEERWWTYEREAAAEDRRRPYIPD